ncbi:MAG TPA: acetylornithine/succinylornithine family transaminase [Gemmatimonadaceae bacterium]|nr:acetylornithine/succinylornithine family transaminase [Gemmatimonadaceae bacterium]
MTMLPTLHPVDVDAAQSSAPSEALLGVYRRPPVEFVRGAGVELIAADGRAYLDFTSGIGVNALGYGDAGIATAMREALDTGMVHTSNLFRTAPGARLAEWLVQHTGLANAFFCNSGAEANEGAFKFARRWAREVGGAEKHELLALRGGFHGRLFASLAATDRPHYRAPFRPLAGGVSIVERDLRALDRALDAETVAALIVEPVQGEGGVRVLDASYLRELRALTRERRVALIVDEIQCGLGRTGRLFAYEHAEITPDLVTLAKPIAGGLPMGAVVVSSEIAATVRPGDHGTTFGGGPLVASVALHVVERLADPALLSHVQEVGAWLRDALASLAERTGRIRAVRGVGLMWGVDVMQPAADVVKRALEAGLLLCSAGEYTVRLLPPLIVSRDELARGLSVLEEVLS